MAQPDPVLVRRARIAAAASWGKRIGYTVLLVSMVVFFAGLITGFTSTVAAIVVACLGLSTVTLAPAIVAGYAVRAAEREDAVQQPPDEGEQAPWPRPQS